MKANRILLALGLVALVSASCEKTYDYQIKTKLDTPATFGITIADMEDTLVLMPPKTKSYTVNIKAPAIADEMVTITVGPNPAKVAEFNKAHGTAYEIVPSDAYSLSTPTFILPRYNTTGTTAELKFNSSAMPDDHVAHLLPLSILKIEGTDKVEMSPADSTVYIFFRRKSLPASGFELGTGTQADPYIIRNKTEMMCVSRAMKSGKKIFFKMDADVDITGEEWFPANCMEPYDMAVDFDGAGHKITGLTSNADAMPSMFGVLVGSVHDVTFEKCQIDVNASQAGLLGASAGTETAAASVKNVTVNGLTINCFGSTTGLGGLVGNATGATFENVKVDVKIVDANDDAKMPSGTGGFVGQCTKVPSTFTKCSTSGTVLGNQSSAGFCGYIDTVEGVKFENCSTSCKVTTLGQRSGGFLGYGKALNITLIGCSSTGDVTTGGNYTGGLIGGFNGASTVKKCFTTGNFVANAGNHHGGLIGNCGLDATSTGATLIEDCYTTGNVTLLASSGRMGGGLVGVCEKALNVTIRRCYATGDVTSPTQQVGGIISFAKSADLVGEDINFTCAQCIAWNKNLTATAPTATNWASGAIIGTSNIKNTVTDCYRRPDMVLSDTGDSGRNYKLFDCENTAPSSPMTWYNSGTSYYPHHGKAAPAGSTVSSVAKSLGWPTDVWDLSGDLPKLK